MQNTTKEPNIYPNSILEEGIPSAALSLYALTSDLTCIAWDLDNLKDILSITDRSVLETSPHMLCALMNLTELVLESISTRACECSQATMEAFKKFENHQTE